MPLPALLLLYLLTEGPHVRHVDAHQRIKPFDLKHLQPISHALSDQN
jgi:hypothetical protein